MGSPYVGGLDAAHWRDVLAPPTEDVRLVDVAAFGYGGEVAVRITRVRVERRAVVAADAWSASAEVVVEHATGGGAEFGGGAKVVRRSWGRVIAQETALLSHLLRESRW